MLVLRGFSRRACLFALAAVLVATMTLAFPGVSRAAFVYSIPKQQDQLTINADGSVTLVRYFEFKVESSSSDAGTEIWAGLPTSSTKITSVVDQDGKSVRYSTRSSGGEFVVTLTGFSIKPGTSKGFTVTATIPNFVYRDTRNAGYATMEYIPGWWSAPVAVQDIAVVLPPKVEKAEIKTGSRLWDGIAQTKEGAYVVTWQFRDLAANSRVSINVGIPDKYVAVPGQEVKPVPSTPPTWTPTGRTGFDPSSMMGIFAVIVIGMVVVSIIANRNREAYSSPQVTMEGVGVNETLTPVEASVLLRQPPEKTLTLLIFSLVKKGILRVTSQEEPLRVAVVYERDLSEAERLFVEAVDRATGEINGSKLVPCFKYLANSVNEKMRPYCRKETEEFYRGAIKRAWDEVSAAETPELKLSAMDRNFLWLLQDEDRMKDAENQFPRDRAVEALPNWWMMGFMFNRPFGYPYYMWPGAVYGRYMGIYGGLLNDQERQNLRTISEEIWTPAHNPARPILPRGGGSSYHGGFTPPSCACACACVSCACACACAGGGGCT